MNRKMLVSYLLFFYVISIGIAPAVAQEPVAPVPASAFDPDVDLSNGYFVEEISDGLYWATDGTYQIMFLTTGEGVIVVDAPPSMAGVIMTAIADVTDEPITHVIYSHSHADHIGGAGIYPEDAIYIAHEDTAAQLEQAMGAENPTYGVFVGGGAVPLPTETFSESYTLEVGNQVLELEYRGIIHEPGNIFIYAPQQKVLMLVDVIVPGWVPFSQLNLAEDVPNFYRAHDEILSYDFETFIGGHMGRLGTREDVETQQEYLLEIRENAANALATTDFFAIAEEVGFENRWLLVDTYLDRVAQACTDATVPNWVGRLAAADVFTYSHCWTVMESLRIDPWRL